MKIPLPNYYLQNLKNQPLPEITPDDVDATFERAELESLQQRKDAILAKFEQESSKNISNEGFKTPMLFKGRKYNTSCTPSQLPKSVNLGFSQPSTPKTRYNTVTPSLSQIKAESFSTDGFVIPTPMVLSALDNFQRESTAGTSQVPDILDFIDDDTHDMTSVEDHILRYSELELTDNNVVDYLLETTDDLLHLLEKTVPKPKRPVTSVWTCLEDQPLRRMTRRRHLHSKVITAELEKSLREIQKAKAKERRKERKEKFKQKQKGTRRSSRRRSQVKYY